MFSSKEKKQMQEEKALWLPNIKVFQNSLQILSHITNVSFILYFT